MDNLVIFQSKPINIAIWIIFAGIVLMHVTDALLGLAAKRARATVKRVEKSVDANALDKREYYLSLINVSRLNIFSSIFAVLNLLLHVGEFVCLLYVKATLAEIMFLLMISSAIALTVNKIKGEE